VILVNGTDVKLQSDDVLAEAHANEVISDALFEKYSEA